ncbi:Hypothetical protein, putative [Bodo saltans]|uniref:Uncharacterized protein n=1 Tax=Bodo saltans TaxID=75058 RepID=A0A0S4IK58_BODSA|nr:Hypothetical protein, putative [Bodo saltans]|eukprot:CUE63318.1 Hypothetical protein, putative [Bodo saltans]
MSKDTRSSTLITNGQGSVVRDPFTAPISLTGECTTDNLRIGLLQMFICYSPTQIMQVPKLIAKFKHIGKQALSETQKRFGQLPLPGEVYNVLRTCPRTRLCVYYASHAPEKIAQVDDMLANYRNYEAELWNVLREKYGPETPPHLLFENWEELDRNQNATDQPTRFRSSSSFDLTRSSVFATDGIEGKQMVWHRDPEQQARDFGRSNDLDSSGASDASFAMFSPASFVYPQHVVKRAASIMLREDSSPEKSVNSSDDFGSMFSSPTSPEASASPKRSIDADEVTMILKAANLDIEDLCPAGGRPGQALQPLPEELSPAVHKPQQQVQPLTLNMSMLSSNASFLSPRSARRRQTQVSFVMGQGESSPHHAISGGKSPPSALARQELGPLEVSLPPALAARAPVTIPKVLPDGPKPKSLLADDFDKL